MRRLVLKNLGPISHADISFGRTTFLTGVSDSGKSTVITAAAFMGRLEQEFLQKRSAEGLSADEFEKRFEAFGSRFQLTNGTAIRFETDRSVIDFANGVMPELKVIFKSGSLSNGKKIRTMVIPENRSAVTEIGKERSCPEQCIFAPFEKAWKDIRRASAAGPMEIFGTSCSYRFDSANRRDLIILPSCREICFSNMSGGMISRTPLVLVLTQKCRSDFDQTDFYIEKPESYLHPADQRSVRTLLARTIDRGDTVTVETNSLSLIYGWNSLLVAKQRMQESREIRENIKAILPSAFCSGIEDTAAYELKDGISRPIMDEVDRIIQAESLDQASDSLSREFEALLAL